MDSQEAVRGNRKRTSGPSALDTNEAAASTRLKDYESRIVGLVKTAALAESNPAAGVTIEADLAPLQE